MYYDSQGREVEDVEGENMRKNAREGNPYDAIVHAFETEKQAFWSGSLHDLQVKLHEEIRPMMRGTEDRIAFWKMCVQLHQLRLLDRIAYELEQGNLLASGEIDRVPDDIAFKVPVGMEWENE